MTNPLQGSDEETQERMAQVRARLDAVGVVEWRSMRDGNQYLYGVEGQRYLPSVEAVHASRVDGLARAWNPHAVIRFMTMDAAHVSRFRDEEADLIAAAPSDLRFLLSRVDSLESALREAPKDVRRQFADEGWEIASVKAAAQEMDRLSSMVRIEAAQRIAAERLHARHCGLECCEVRDEYEAKTRQQPIGDTREST